MRCRCCCRSTLLATPGVETLRRGAANAWYWFSIMGFTFFILVAWVYWSGLELGVPPRLHAHLHRMQPGYTPGFKLLPFTLGALYTIAWFAVLARLKRNPQRPAIVWGAGVTVTWALLATLFIGWIDTGKSYRGMIASLTAAMPAKYRCMSSRELGEPQRAMLHYFAGIVTYREEAPERRRDCDLMLVQGTPQEEKSAARELDQDLGREPPRRQGRTLPALPAVAATKPRPNDAGQALACENYPPTRRGSNRRVRAS